MRERALKFLYMKLKTESKELLNREGEIHLFEEIKACTFEVISLDGVDTTSVSLPSSTSSALESVRGPYSELSRL